ncbi:hypothetical protein GCM10010280_55240 [Streptomyces pilosus]|uniref:Uncharacterized protein n=1 Tax=Streptomyces pilosus TaxID=28893 RepID=A0A918C243_9ACTN|nr:hypothetical protein GCM10010280_55240 [Streptomyces pilosus]
MAAAIRRGSVNTPAAYAGWRKTAQNMAVPCRFNPPGPGNKKAEPRSSVLGDPTPWTARATSRRTTPPAPGLPKAGFGAPPPGRRARLSSARTRPGRGPDAVRTLPRKVPGGGERATPNLNPGVAHQMADCATWA